MRRLLCVPLLAVCLAVLPKPVEGAVIEGILDIAGGVQVTQDTIDWYLPFGGGFGDAIVQASSTLSFAGLGGTIDRQLDLNISAVAGVGLPLDNFQTLLAQPTWNFVLEDVLSCGEINLTATPQFLCPLGNDNPFAFAQSFPGGSEVTLVMTGIVYDTLTPTLISNWTGIYTAQFPGQPIFTTAGFPNPEGVLDEFLRLGLIDTSFSASKITVTQAPEPLTLGLFGLSLLGVGIRARRRH
jgi:hypothetical protein